MTDQRREVLRKKYLSLGMGELVASAVFAGAAVTAVQPRLVSGEHRALWAALVPLIWILVQCGAFWLLARSWVHLRPMPSGLAGVYRVFRVLNVGLLVASLVAIVWWRPERLPVLILCVVIWLFAVVEHLNYYVVRLAYPVTQWFSTVGQWRRPRLVQDLQQSSPGR